MHRFFADEDGRIRGDEYKHLTRVLRLSEGDEIEALTGEKESLQAELDALKESSDKAAVDLAAQIETLTADKIIVATGSVNAVPPIPGLRENPNCIDSTGALSLEKLPQSMVVIGGGVIGLELACAYAAFGTKISVVEALDHILPMLDGEVIRSRLRDTYV